MGTVHLGERWWRVNQKLRSLLLILSRYSRIEWLDRVGASVQVFNHLGSSIRADRSQGNVTTPAVRGDLTKVCSPWTGRPISSSPLSTPDPHRYHVQEVAWHFAPANSLSHILQPQTDRTPVCVRLLLRRQPTLSPCYML